MPGSPPNYTVSDIFDKLGKNKWWLPQYVGERFGESYNGYPEYGTDFGIPAGTSVGSISDGTVVYSGYQGTQGCTSLG